MVELVSEILPAVKFVLYAFAGLIILTAVIVGYMLIQLIREWANDEKEIRERSREWLRKR